MQLCSGVLCGCQNEIRPWSPWANPPCPIFPGSFPTIPWAAHVYQTHLFSCSLNNPACAAFLFSASAPWRLFTGWIRSQSFLHGCTPYQHILPLSMSPFRAHPGPGATHSQVLLYHHHLVHGKPKYTRNDWVNQWDVKYKTMTVGGKSSRPPSGLMTPLEGLTELKKTWYTHTYGLLQRKDTDCNHKGKKCINWNLGETLGTSFQLFSPNGIIQTA